MDFTVLVFCLLKFGDENNSAYPSRWSVPEIKDRQSNISIFSRIYEEYTDAEHFFEFTRKTAAILLQTSINFPRAKQFISFFFFFSPN
jgi:hypothetical protein